MERLDNACNKILELQQLTGKNDKAAYLETHKDDEDFKTLLRHRYDIFKAYGIKKFPPIQYCTAINMSLTFDAYITMLDDLADNNINDARRKYAALVIASGNYKHAEILEGIVTKSLSLGVDTTVKKFLNLIEISPMLASPVKEETVVPMPCIVELKYDGVRAVAMVENGKCLLYTRQGRLLQFPQLEREFVQLANGEDITFDTELEMVARTGISGVCNSNLKKGYLNGADDFIEVFVFDEIPTAIFKAKGLTKKQKERTSDLQKRFANFTKAKRLKLGVSQTVYSIEKLKEINNKYIAEGFEGVIIKDPEAPYAYKRSKAWLKMKAINSTTLKVVAIELGKGKRAGKVGALICESSCGGIKVKVGSGLNDDDVATYTDTPPIGKFVEVLFNVLIKGRDSDDYSLFLPRYKEMRIDKSGADSLKKVKNEHIGKIEE